MPETRPPSPDATETFVEFADLAETLRRQGGWILATFVLTLLAAGTWTALQTPRYQASSTMLVKFGREFLADPSSSSARLVGRSRETLLNSELEILRSRSVLEGMVQTVGVDTLYPDLEAGPAKHRLGAAADRASQALRVRVVDETELIRTSFVHEDAELAATALTAILDAFRAKHLEAFSDAGAVQVFEDTVADDAEHLRAAEAALQGFEAQHRAFYLAEPNRMLMGQRVELQSALNEVEGQLADARRLLTEEPEPLRQARTDLLALELEREELLGRYEATSLPVANLDARIALLEGFVAERVSETDASRTANLAPLRQRRRSLRARLTELDAEIASLPELQARHRELTRTRDTVEARYEARLAQLDEQRMAQEMGRRQIANIRVVQAPAAPLEPISPSLTRNLAMGAVLGLVLGIGLALLREQLGGPGAGLFAAENDLEDAGDELRVLPKAAILRRFHLGGDRATGIRWPLPTWFSAPAISHPPRAEWLWRRTGIGRWVREPGV